MNAGVQGFLNTHKSLREPRGSAEPGSLASMRTWLKTLILGGTLVRGIGLCAPSAGGLSLILGQGTRSHKPKFRPGTAKTKKNKKQNNSANSCAFKKYPSFRKTGHFECWEILCPLLGIIWRRLLLSSREGNGTPLQYSCLENPRDGGAWWAAVYGILQARILEWGAIAFSGTQKQSSSNDT